MDVSLIQAINYDFQILEQNIFDPSFDFFDDSALPAVPINLTGSSFTMTIKKKDGGHCFGTTLNEVLTIGNGLTIENDDKGNINNRLQVSKVLQSIPGHYKQYVMWTDSLGKPITIERGSLQIESL